MAPKSERKYLAPNRDAVAERRCSTGEDLELEAVYIAKADRAVADEFVRVPSSS